jgi:hypothetical protein
MQSLRVFVSSGLVFIALAAPSAIAATPTGWEAVKALPPHTHVQVRTDALKSDCHLVSVTEDKLTCAEASFARSEIKSIKRIDKTKSTLGGLALGAGVGAGIGVGIGSAINAGDKGSLVHVSEPKASGAGAAVGAVIGAGIGALVGHATNLFAATIYKR